MQNNPEIIYYNTKIHQGTLVITVQSPFVKQDIIPVEGFIKNLVHYFQIALNKVEFDGS